jgi:hypothetical protein
VLAAGAEGLAAAVDARVVHSHQHLQCAKSQEVFTVFVRAGRQPMRTCPSPGRGIGISRTSATSENDAPVRRATRLKQVGGNSPPSDTCGRRGDLGGRKLSQAHSCDGGGVGGGTAARLRARGNAIGVLVVAPR